MKVSISEDFEKRERTDLLLLPYWEGPEAASEHSPRAAAPLLASGDFKGKAGETALLYLEGEKEPRILLLGLGKKRSQTAESLRRFYAGAVKCAQAKKAKSIHLVFPKFEKLLPEEALRGVCEGIFLANYAFMHLKGETVKKDPPVLLQSLSISGIDKKAQKQIDRLQTIASAVCFVRDLVNGNADEINPNRMAQEARSLGKKIKTTVLNKKRLEAEGMGLLLAVGRASKDDPCLIVSSYRGNPKSNETVVLVGKGITYDTGGLHIKQPDNMVTQKADMAGAATVLAAVKLAAELELKVNVTVLAPIAENAIGSGSYKLGDVYRSCSGKTVEVLNTDAEGRLILADAISYAVKHLRPACIIDVGTLTGGIVVALGEEMAGLFSNDEQMVKDFTDASAKTGESLWRMPLYDYKESLRSDIADLANVGGRDGGSIKCALFIQEFTNGIPWAHIDLAGPAYVTKPKYYNPTKGTGWGVRLLVDFLEGR